jgi:hypothetical protein
MLDIGHEVEWFRFESRHISEVHAIDKSRLSDNGDAASRITFMKTLLLRFAKDEAGVSTIEHGLIASVIAVACF